MSDSRLLGRPYAPPVLFIFEEVEIGHGYHSLTVTDGPARGWSEPYRKSGPSEYRSRVMRVPYPPISEHLPTTPSPPPSETVFDGAFSLPPPGPISVWHDNSEPIRKGDVQPMALDDEDLE